MIPIKCLHLILFLLLALHVRVVGAAPLPAQGANPVQVERFPAFVAIPVVQPGSNHLRGPPRAKFQDDGGREIPRQSEYLLEILMEREGGYKPDQEAVKNEAFPERSSNSLPVGAAERRLMRGTSVLDAVSERAVAVPPPKPTVVYLVCPEDVRRRCMISTAAILVSLLCAGLLWCCGMHWWRKRKERQAAASSTVQSRDRNQQPPRPPSRGPPRPPSPSVTSQQQDQDQAPTRPPAPNPPPRPTGLRVLP